MPNTRSWTFIYGAEFVDRDVAIDGDLVTARTGKHCHLFARTIVGLLAAKSEPAALQLA